MLTVLDCFNLIFSGKNKFFIIIGFKEYNKKKENVDFILLNQDTGEENGVSSGFQNINVRIQKLTYIL